MVTKLRIDLAAGLLEVEGEEGFVREIYQDFRDRRFGEPNEPERLVTEQFVESLPPSGKPSSGNGQRPKRRQRRAVVANTESEGGKAGVSNYQPKLDSSLDVSGAKSWLSKYQPKSHSERILIFAKYLESIGKENITVDQIYTCYAKCSVRPPKAFGQALIDARGKTYGFINFTGVDDITITILGHTHFAHDMTLAGAVA